MHKLEAETNSSPSAALPLPEPLFILELVEGDHGAYDAPSQRRPQREEQDSSSDPESDTGGIDMMCLASCGCAFHMPSFHCNVTSVGDSNMSVSPPFHPKDVPRNH